MALRRVGTWPPFHRLTSCLLCRRAVPAGDITDANKPLLAALRGQNVEEWDMYRAALSDSAANDIPWLDVRGNHDAFNVPL